MAINLKVRLKSVALSRKLAVTGSDLIEIGEFSVLQAPEGVPIPSYLSLELGAVSLP